MASLQQDLQHVSVNMFFRNRDEWNRAIRSNIYTEIKLNHKCIFLRRYCCHFPQFRTDKDTTHNLVLECEDGSKRIYYRLIQLQTAQWGRIRFLSALTSSTLRPRNKSSKGSVLSPPLSSCRSFTWLRRSFSSSSLDGETKCLVTFCFTSIKFPLSGHLNRYSFKILDSTLTS